jgi:hypothetical protein
VEVEELVMAPGGTYQRPAPLVPVTRPVGQNDVGVLAWQLTMRTPECPQGRKVRTASSVPRRRPARAAAALAVLCSRRAAAPAPRAAAGSPGEARGAGAAQVIAIANDITHNSGAFGPREDAVFRGATELALAERLPLVYLAANSGARVGLAAEVKACLQARGPRADTGPGSRQRFERLGRAPGALHGARVRPRRGAAGGVEQPGRPDQGLPLHVPVRRRLRLGVGARGHRRAEG